MNNELVKLNNICKKYSGIVVLENINLSITRNMIIVITGVNGCGKSTLLRIIAGITPPTDGKIVYAPDGRIKIGYVPDRFPVLPFRGQEYLRYMGCIQGISGKAVTERINDLFREFNAENLKDVMLRNMSKGSLQKIAFMQAIMSKVELLVLDEPFSGMDNKTREFIPEILLNMKNNGCAIILAAHEYDLINNVSDRCAEIKKHRLVPVPGGLNGEPEPTTAKTNGSGSTYSTHA